MKIIVTAATVLLLVSATADRAVADRSRPRGERETKLERKEIDAAIAAAEKSGDELLRAVDDALDETKQDRKQREAMIRESLDELVAALARLREKFDADGPWTDQRAEARLAMTQWNKLDPKLRHHWISEARDEFEDVHRDLRTLGRIYEIDSPSRT